MAEIAPLVQAQFYNIGLTHSHPCFSHLIHCSLLKHNAGTNIGRISFISSTVLYLETFKIKKDFLPPIVVRYIWLFILSQVFQYLETVQVRIGKVLFMDEF